MNFFEQQDAARRRTWLLVLLFTLGVVGTVLAVDAAVSFILIAADHGRHAPDAPVTVSLVGLAVLAVVIGGSTWKSSQLRGGGRVIAEQLGGRHLHGGNADEDGRRLLNVVEEMSLASGVPAPDVYLLPDEDAINAFAAGHTPSDAVLGVTQGAVKRLNREQLQGVVAHEFSHILNGDMALDLRLIGWVHGLLVIGLLGQIIVRNLRFARSSGGRNKGGGLAIVLAVGLALLLLGFIGMFFARLIKAAVSRQREYLADAAAVQFTRNPTGLSGALKLIGALPLRGQLRAPAAEVASHLFFARGSRRVGWLDTHPPLEERIRRLEPGWDGSFPELAARPVTPPASAPPRDEDDFGQLLPEGLAALALVGRPQPAHLAWAEELLAGLPEALLTELREPFGARAAAYALILSEDQSVESPGLPVLREVDPAAAALVLRLLPRLRELGPSVRLPLLDLLLPALRAQSEAQFEQFRRNVEALIAADGAESLFEWVLRRLLVEQVEQQLGRGVRPKLRQASLQWLAAETQVLLSAVAHAAGAEPAPARSFARAAAELRELPELKLLPPEGCGPAALTGAVSALAAALPFARQQLLDACAAGITADDEATVQEAELLRALAISLNCPMPPVLPGQPLRPRDADRGDAGRDAA